MPPFKSSPGLRQWHTVIDSMLEVKNVSNFPVHLCMMMNGMSLQFNLTCANRCICAIACTWLSPKHCEHCKAYRSERARPMACFCAYHITCAAQTNTSSSNNCKCTVVHSKPAVHPSEHRR